MKKLAILFLMIFSVGFPASALEDDSLEAMIEISMQYHNTNYETYKGNTIISKLANEFGNEKVLVTLLPEKEIVSVSLVNGKVEYYKIGEEIPGVSVDVEVHRDTFEEVFTSGDPLPAFTNSWQNDRISVKTRKTAPLKLKTLALVANIAKGFLGLFK